MRYLFCAFILIGLILLIISIKYIIRFVNADMVHEMPCIRRDDTFTLARKGQYGVWLSGKMFTRTPAGEFGLDIINQQTGESVPLAPNLLCTRVNGFKNGRIELYLFRAEEGTYTISLTDGADIREKLGALIIHAADKGPVDYSLFSIQIRKHDSIVILLLCIWGIILGSGAIISGIILPIVYV